MIIPTIRAFADATSVIIIESRRSWATFQYRLDFLILTHLIRFKQIILDIVSPLCLTSMSSKSVLTTGHEGQRSRFAWQEVEQGFWERDIDKCEMFYVHSARNGRKCYPLTGCATFKTHPTSASSASDVKDTLRKAWLMLSRSHPTLVSHVEHEKATGRWKLTLSGVPR